MPLTHDMGLIGFHLFMFANRVHCHLMPTELFVRRPLLWLQFASRMRATILCSPNFGYRHYLKVLGERAPEGLDLSAVRLIFNGAEPISVELCEEFLARMAARAPRAQRDVPGVRARRSLARRELPAARARRCARSLLNRHRMSVGDTGRAGAEGRHAMRSCSSPWAAPIPYCRRAHRR